jgi:hypothetical protein
MYFGSFAGSYRDSYSFVELHHGKAMSRDYLLLLQLAEYG